MDIIDLPSFTYRQTCDLQREYPVYRTAKDNGVDAIQSYTLHVHIFIDITCDFGLFSASSIIRSHEFRGWELHMVILEIKT